WKIDIKSEEEKRQEVEDRMNVVLNQPATPLESVPDLEPGIIEKLVAAGITTVESVADMTPEQLEEVPGIAPKTVEKISIAVNNYFSSLDAAANAGNEEVPLPEDEVSTEAEGATEAEAPTEAEAATEDEACIEGGAAESATGPDSGGQSGDVTGLDEEPEAGPDSVEDLVETGQYYEA